MEGAALNGVNMLSNNLVRDDLPNLAPPSVGAGTTLLKKQNFSASGLVGLNY